MRVHGIHHVTAITANAKRNLDFYTGVLGLRLVKKTVNQDDVRAYHLFYADAKATPGTDITFFEWPNVGANRPGPGSVDATVFRVDSHAALSFWESRFLDSGVVFERSGNAISFSDPEGQALQLEVFEGFPNDATPWAAQVPAESAVSGIGAVEIPCVRIDATRAVLAELLGFEETSPGQFETRGESTYSQVRLTESTARTLGHPGAGGVHHVAFRVKDDGALHDFQNRLESVGFGTSGFVDRFYFHSLYFREPGGVLFELATDGPGMGSDEPMEALGEKLSLPPFLEARREEIERNLSPIG